MVAHHWFAILAWNTTDQTVTVSIQGIRYEYWLKQTADDVKREVEKRKRNPGQQLSYIKKLSYKYTNLTTGATHGSEMS